MPGREELPSTLQRSSRKAQETWVKAHDNAVQEYGEGERSHRTAYGALKHSFEKVGDHWEAKAGGAKGPSGEQSARPRGQSGESYGGVDANASKEHLLGLARRLGVPGRSAMSKQDLARAIERANDQQTATARGVGSAGAAPGRRAPAPGQRGAAEGHRDDRARRRAGTRAVAAGPSGRRAGS